MKRLTKFEEDIFREIASLGSGFASNSLSKMIKKEVKVSAPVIEVINIDDISKQPKFPALGTILRISGEIKGIMAIISEKRTGMLFLDIIKGKGRTRCLDAEDRDILKEIGNIMVGSYLSVISDVSRLNMLESIPELMVSDSNRILKHTIREYDGRIKDVLSLRTRIDIDKDRLDQDIFLFMKESSIDKLFAAMIKNKEKK